jgi:hypothetical protein
MFIDPHDHAAEEGEPEATEPVQKQQKLMADAMKTTGSYKAKKPAPAKPKKTVRNIPAAEKNKANVPLADEEEEAPVLQKLRPRLPTHNDAHPVAENMKLRKDKGHRKWREADPYAQRRKTAVDNRFYTKEQQDFYETVLMDKKPVVADMRYVDWKYIDDEEHKDFFPMCMTTLLLVVLQISLVRSLPVGMMR